MRRLLVLCALTLLGCQFDDHRQGEVCTRSVDCAADEVCQDRVCVARITVDATADAARDDREASRPAPGPRPRPEAAPPPPPPRDGAPPPPNPDAAPPLPDMAPPRPVVDAAPPPDMAPPRPPPPVFPADLCPERDDTICVAPSDDVTVHSDRQASASRRPDLRVARAPGAAPRAEWFALLRFELPDPPRDGRGAALQFRRARLELTLRVNEPNDGPSLVIERIGTRWEEDTADWFTRLDPIRPVRVEDPGAPPERESFNVDRTLEEAYESDDGAIAFRLRPEGVDEALWIFDSRDAIAGDPPVLELEFQ